MYTTNSISFFEILDELVNRVDFPYPHLYLDSLFRNLQPPLSTFFVRFQTNSFHFNSDNTNKAFIRN